MLFNSKLLFHLLDEQYQLTRRGRILREDMYLRLPVFYDRSFQLSERAIYIARTQDLPANCAAACLFICLGAPPQYLYQNWAGEIFFIGDPGLDILTLFNSIMDHYNQILQWDNALQQLRKECAEIEEFVRVSLPLFNNCISIADYNLRLLVNSDVEEVNGVRRVQISKEFDRIPDAVGVGLQKDYLQYSNYREPFRYTGQRENPDGENYCVNLYLGNTYIGSCALWEKMRPMRESDFILFQHFAEYMKDVMTASSPLCSASLVTMKDIFNQLIQRFPVSKEEYSDAMSLLEADMRRQQTAFGNWQCVVIHSANRRKALPEQYICTSIEGMLSNATAMAYDGRIVVFCMIPKGETCEDAVCDILLPYLTDMNFRAGVSESFDNVFDAYDYYRQAVALLDTGARLSPVQHIYRFNDYALPYMLMNSIGDFTPEVMFSSGLRELLKGETGVDYWETLRRYLDNECNATRTTQDLFLHRSSLLPRLKKIQSIVDMDTPEQRLYLRICLYLKDYWDTIKDNRT